MTNADLILPLDALPAMDRLMTYFNLALKESIKLYQQDQKRHEFEQAFLKYERDLDLFEQSYINWTRLDTINKSEKIQLNQLEPKMAEAKDLILLARKFITH